MHKTVIVSVTIHNEKCDNLEKLHGMAKVTELIHFEIQNSAVYACAERKPNQ